MEILGIGPGEFVLILIVLLVVVGPERLPGLARQAGSFLVRARNWLQTSPDAALVMRARAEIEAELASIKNSLMEVQVVRDEVLGAARQLEDSVGSISAPKFDLNSLVNSPAEQTIAANGQALPAGTASDLVLADGTTPASIPLDQRSTLELPAGSAAPIPSPAEAQPTNGLANGSSHTGAVPGPAVGATAAPTSSDLESINIRLQAIMADIWALQEQLKQHGALDQNWQPPSFDVQLPAQETAPLAGGEVSPETLLAEEPIAAPPEEPIVDPVVLAARKRLEELTPMNVSFHAPPPIEQAAAESVSSEVAVAEAGVAETSTDLPALVDPLAAAPKPRKRRASSTASQKANDPAEPTVEGAPAPKTRKRRAPTASAVRADETEPVTTEKAS